MMVAEGNESKKAGYKVPFGTVSITDKAKSLIDEAIATKWVTKGKYVKEFEEKFAALFGVKYGVAVSSGTDADALSCAVLYDYGAKRGDEIIIPALTFVATGNAVLQAGFTPKFVDVDRKTLNIDPNKIEEVITDKTCAIMPVHLSGCPADMPKIMKIAEKHNLKVIEDAAQAILASIDGQHVGSWGEAAGFSLHPLKNLNVWGDGGIIVMRSEEMRDQLRLLRNHGMKNRDEIEIFGHMKDDLELFCLSKHARGE